MACVIMCPVEGIGIERECCPPNDAHRMAWKGGHGVVTRLPSLDCVDHGLPNSVWIVPGASEYVSLDTAIRAQSNGKPFGGTSNTRKQALR